MDSAGLTDEFFVSADSKRVNFSQAVVIDVALYSLCEIFPRGGTDAP